MNNLDNIGVDELDYDIQNHIKIYWFELLMLTNLTKTITMDIYMELYLGLVNMI
jgi:hypothetical protein